LTCADLNRWLLRLVADGSVSAHMSKHGHDGGIVFLGAENNPEVVIGKDA
jgi:hypothetical protein